MTAMDLRNTPSPFDAIRHRNPRGIDCWSGRELMLLLGYEQWRNFADAIDRARAACHNSGMPAQDHFADASKVIPVGKGAQRSVADVHMTRYGAYLVAMNGDPRKPEIAAAQTYFAVRTREAEMNAQVPPQPSVSDIHLRTLIVQLEADQQANQARRQLDILAAARAQVEILNSLQGLVDPGWLDVAGRHVAALALNPDATGADTIETPAKGQVMSNRWDIPTVAQNHLVGADKMVPRARSEDAMIRQWVSDACEPYDPGTRAAVLHAAFADWCQERRIPHSRRPSMTLVGRRLTAFGYPPRRGAVGRNYRPLRLRSEPRIEHMPY